MLHHGTRRKSHFYLILGGGIRDAGRGMLLPLPCDGTLVVPATPPRDLVVGGLSPETPWTRPPCIDSTRFTAIWAYVRSYVYEGHRATQNHIMLHVTWHENFMKNSRRIFNLNWGGGTTTDILCGYLHILLDISLVLTC